MTEREYITVNNRAKLNLAEELIRDCQVNQDDESMQGEVILALRRLRKTQKLPLFEETQCLKK